ncbi:hypothetical protein DIPPA_28893 [Diplonema papillatum]|nr:hypothetical protein DIPPA_28893 [Diplonema papillatum]
MGLSIKSISIGATVTCVLVTVLLSLVLSVQTTDRALDRTNEHHDETIKECFATSEAQLVEMTESLLEEMSLTVASSMHGMLDELVDVHKELSSTFAATQSADVGSFALYDKYRGLVAAAHETKKVTLVTTATMDGFGLMTLQMNPLEYEVERIDEVADFKTAIREPNTTMLIEFGAAGSTFGTMTPHGGFYPEPCVNGFWVTQVVSGACPLGLRLDMFPLIGRLLESNVTNIAAAKDVDDDDDDDGDDDDELEHAEWSAIYGTGTYAAIALQGVWTVPQAPFSNVNPAGYVLVSHDLRSVDAVLKAAADREVIFVVLGDSGRPEEVGWMVGTTHGNATHVVRGEDFITGAPADVVMPIHCLNSTDPVVQGSCARIYTQLGARADPFAAAYGFQTIVGTFRFEVQVPGSAAVEYFIRMHPITDSIGLRWWILLLVDVDSIVGTVNRKRAIAAAAVEEANQDIKNNLESDRIMMYVWIVIVVLLMVVASGFGTTVMTRPLEQLRKDMEMVAKMNLDVVDTSRPKSRLKEVRSMQTSFHSMIDSMKEFKQYMPVVLLREGGDEEGSASDEDRGEGTPNHRAGTGTKTSRSDATSDSKGAPLAKRKGSGKNQEMRHQDTSGTEGSSGMGSGSKTGPQNPGRKSMMSVFLTRKQRTAHVRASCRDFTRLVKLVADTNAIVEFHTAWLHACIADAQDWQGSVVCFQADHVDVNFGGLTPCISPATKAAKYALKMRGRFLGMRSEHLLRAEALTQSGCALPAVGLASGSVYVGNLGCQGLKAPAVLGRAAQHAGVMRTLASEIGLDIVMDQNSVDELKGVIVCTPIDVVRLEPGKMQIAYYLSEAMSAAAGEWMYTMDAGVGEGESYDKAWGMLRSGDVSAAAELFQSMKDSDTALAVGARLARYVDDVSAVTGKAPNSYCRVQRKRGTVPGVIAESVDNARRAGGSSRLLPSKSRYKNASSHSLSSRASSRSAKSSRGAGLPAQLPNRMSAQSFGSTPPPARDIA